MSTDDQEPVRQPASTAPAGAAPWEVARAAEIIQTVLTGLILAFIFRAFMVEPFVIPTGSMADALLGAHATQTCPACGWEFDFAPLRSAVPAGAGFECPREIVCPNCQLHLDTTPENTVPKAGDRLLVHKWPYALGGPFGPQRWDVVVFRDPANPSLHFIKRLVGLPGEAVEIVDGDLFINGCIARKPPDVQRGLWFIVFDQAHLPDAQFPSGRLPRWAATTPSPPGGRGWSGMNTRVIRYDALDQTQRKIAFNPDTGREYLLDLYAYNRGSSGALVGDVRIVCELTLEAGDGLCRWELTRPPCRFAAELHRDGTLRLNLESLAHPGVESTLRARVGPVVQLGCPIAVEFGHVDYRVYLKVDGHEILATTDPEYAPQLPALRVDPGDRPINLSIAATNLRFALRGLRIDRDLYYTTGSERVRRARPGEPFALRAGEYFVLGDNSPNSHDSREWTEAELGPHLPAACRPGTVLADQIVGQAAFVYLPGLLSVGTSGRWLVPDLGRVRFVR